MNVVFRRTSCTGRRQLCTKGVVLRIESQASAGELSPRDFHSVLRNATRCDHQRIDDLYSSLDITTRTGFIVFAQAHAASFELLAESPATGRATRQVLTDMTLRLQDDLVSLAAPRAEIPLHLATGVHPVAVDYVVSGSRLGTNVLRKRWLKSSDPSVHRADAYFGVRSDTRHWHAMVRLLQQIPVASKDAEMIIHGSKVIFGTFAEAFHLTMQSQHESLLHG